MRIANTECTVAAEIFVNGRFLVQSLSGVQRFGGELLLALDELLAEGVIDYDRFRLTVLCPRSVAEPVGYRHIAVREIGRSTGHLWEQAELPAHVRGNLLLNFCNTAPLFNRNQVLTIHDAAVRAVPKAYTRAFRAWYRVMHTLAGAHAARIITVSQFSKRELGERLGLPTERIAVVAEGADHIKRVDSDGSVLKRFSLDRRPFVLTVSNLAAHKNFQAIVRAVEIARLPDVDVVIAGGANPQVFATRSGTLPASVKHVGRVSDGQLRALYERAACFAYPSLYEGFGLPPLEAMACGCPVLAANAASLPEVCGDAALYCDPGSPADIAEKLSQIIADEALRARLREGGSARAAQFTWRRCASEVWQQVLLTLGETPAHSARFRREMNGRPL
jgi:glycosyltransferase involved in cell wall biosynthesis